MEPYILHAWNCDPSQQRNLNGIEQKKMFEATLEVCSILLTEIKHLSLAFKKLEPIVKIGNLKSLQTIILF